MTPAELSRWLADGPPRVLDGAMAGELIRRGVGSAARLWGVGALLDDPAAVRALHREHAAAGAEALTTATFRVAPYSLRKAGIEDRGDDLARLAVRLAREGAAAASSEAVVLGSQTTLEDCWRPDLVPDDLTLEREHTRTAALLAAAGVDAILLETFNTGREARIAAAAAAATGLAVVVSFACRAGGRLLSGEDAAAAAQAVTLPGVVAIGVNCTSLPDLMPALVRIAAATPLPLVAYGNDAFFAADSPWLAAEPAGPDRYARCLVACAAAGARLVGGCCGTTPAHVAAVAAALGRRGAA
jgi:S-methylmethionine-dependent homocysteine/selenocysteine methylase